MQHFINGRSVSASDGAAIELVSPVTESVFGTSAAGTEADVDSAVKAARAQLDGGGWTTMSGVERGALLNKLADLVERDANIIADLDASAIGRLPAEPLMLELPNGIGTLRNAAGWADKLEGRTIPTPGYMGMRTLSYTRLEPVGVVAAIVPWNTPFMITCWKVGPLLAAGCAVVIKPAEETPGSALHLAKLCQEAGFPDGVVNVVTGRGEVVGDALCRHPGVDKVTFTGSPEVGRLIQQTAGGVFKRVALELGGKSPQIVFEDAPFDAAIQGCAAGLFFNQGQVCAAGSRILVQRSIADRFSKTLAGAAASVKVGNPTEPGVQMGAVAKKAQFDRINRYIRKGIEEGAEVLAGGVPYTGRGYFVQPTIFGNASNAMTIAREEIFGPVGTIIPFDTQEEAIAIANDSRYGLGATVWTSDVARAHKVAHAVKAGAVGINCWGPIDPRLPWGGMKSSGIGREGGLSGVLAYTEEKVITVLLP
ncbi:aldehyde dehydrogenase family protein [Ramlibacter sp. WS9]|uniref:aldehyde dehydrogenase family protein n=1 Tax=Ramlibacter sp. WS9 TaxID=1882741 RepID=UPI001E31AC73|nr:aldehyde dehydrogenase family protein [Ramlibacter sp. WS9]